MASSLGISVALRIKAETSRFKKKIVDRIIIGFSFNSALMENWRSSIGLKTTGLFCCCILALALFRLASFCCPF